MYSKYERLRQRNVQVEMIALRSCLASELFTICTVDVQQKTSIQDRCYFRSAKYNRMYDLQHSNVLNVWRLFDMTPKADATRCDGNALSGAIGCQRAYAAKLTECTE